MPGSPSRLSRGSTPLIHTIGPYPKVDQQEVARQDADKAAAERERREEVERQKQERMRMEQVLICVNICVMCGVTCDMHGVKEEV